MKNNLLFLFFVFVFIPEIITAQIGISTNNPEVSSVLDIHSTDKGFLMPRLTTAQRDAISSPATGLLIYNTTTSIFNFYNLGWKDFITGLVLPTKGGTGIANNNLATFALQGGFATTLTTTGITGVTLPTTGTVYGTQTGSITSAQSQHSLVDETGRGKAVFSASPTFTNVPLAPTAIVGTNTTQLATTAFVLANSNHYYYSVNGGGEVSTSSATDVVMPGMMVTPLAGTYTVTFNGQYKIISGNKTAQAADDLQAVYNQLNNYPVTHPFHAPAFGGETLRKGVYAIAGAGTAAGTLTLDAQGDPNALFIIKFAGAFGVTAATTVNLINGASASNVFWLAQGAIGLGASTDMKGNLITISGAIGLGAGCTVEGKVLTSLGAVGIDSSTIKTTTSGPHANLGVLSSFAIFTSSGGNISNSGVSIVTGDIGTNSNTATITGFETAIVNGTFYKPGEVNAMAVFGIYQNGVLIANSGRTRVSSVNTIDVSLQAITTVFTGQNVEVRWSVDSGTLKGGNRILTLVNLR